MNQALPRTLLIDEASTPAAAPSDDDQGFGFADFLSVVFSQRLFMLAILALTMAAGGLYIYLQTPRYFAEAQVVLGPRSGDDSTPNVKGAANAVRPDSALVESEIEILKSNDMMNRLIDMIGPQQVAQGLGVKVKAGAEAAASAERRDLVNELKTWLSVKRQQTSNIISVGFQTPSQTSTVQFANALVDAYLKSKEDEREAASKQAAEWLNRRIGVMAKDVEDKEAEVAAYRAEMQLLSVDGSTLNEKNYFKLQDEVVASRADLAGKQAKLRSIEEIAKAGGDPGAVLDVVNSLAIQQLRQKEAEVAAREADLRTRYADQYPLLIQTVNEHKEVLRQISSEITRTTAAQRNEVEVASTRLRELEGALSKLEGNLVEGNKAIVKLRELERGAEAAAAVYKDFLLRSQEIAEQGSLKVVDARAVSHALQPKQATSTSAKLWLAFFFAAGVLLAVVAATLRAALNDRIVRPETIARRLGVPALVSVPLIHRGQMRKLPPDERTPQDYLVSRPMTSFAESLRVLCAGILSDPDNGTGLAVAVTSALAAEGKTTVSLSMARAAAMSGLRVLVIDCDARRPSLSAAIGDKPAISLTDVIKGRAAWRDAAVVDPLTSATVLPINSSAGEMQSTFRPEAVRKLLSSVRSEFDLIVMDCPPVLAVAETRWLTSVADVTVVIAQWNKTRSSAVRTALREVTRARGRVAGVVLNRTDVDVTRRFSFSDALYYGNAGKGYYTT